MVKNFIIGALFIIAAISLSTYLKLNNAVLDYVETTRALQLEKEKDKEIADRLLESISIDL